MHQRPTYVEDVLNLQPGEWVHVRPLEEIRRTFDRGERTHGMRFMAAMGAYFGKKLRVYKRANVILLEGTAETRRLKNTVLLEGAICQGEGFVCEIVLLFLERVLAEAGSSRARQTRSADR